MRTPPDLAALPEDDPRAWVYKRTSPDGAFAWVATPHEVRMSHWIEAGSLWRVEPPACLLDPGSSWSCEDLRWVAPAELAFTARCYRGDDPAVRVWIDAARGIARVTPFDLAAAHARGEWRHVAVPRPTPEGEISLGVLEAWLAG